jgi:hypothetical protein
MKLPIAMLALAMPLAAQAQDKKFVEPGTQPGPNEEDYTDGILPGDQWARLRLDVDKKGRPTRCGIIATNIRNKERRFWACQAFMSDWHIEPIMKDGVAVPGTVTRMFVLIGKRHPKVKK